MIIQGEDNKELICIGFSNKPAPIFRSTQATVASLNRTGPFIHNTKDLERWPSGSKPVMLVLPLLHNQSTKMGLLDMTARLKLPDLRSIPS